MASITFDNVSKRFGDVPVLQNLNLHIEDREFMVLVGPSGCGKTTALRCLAGLESVSSGRILIGDRCVNDLHPKDRDIAMVFQSYALYPHMTVYDNLAFSLRLRHKRGSLQRVLHHLDMWSGRKKSIHSNSAIDSAMDGSAPQDEPEIAHRVKEVAALLRIDHLLQRKPGSLSGGQQQRVALGRAMVRNPSAFLMDEPLSNLDAQLRTQMRIEISQVHQRIKSTFLYVTHDQTEAMTMGNRIAVMHEGKLQQVDTPQQLYDHPVNQFVAGFIGSPAMNFFEAEFVSDEQAGEGVTLLLNEKSGMIFPIAPELTHRFAPFVGKQLLVGIRPHHIFDPACATLEATGSALEKALVTMVEWMGNEMYGHMQHGTTCFIAGLNPNSKVQPGHLFQAGFMMKHIHLFDPKTKRALL